MTIDIGFRLSAGY